MTLAYNKSTSGHGTDGQTDRQSATQYAAPTEERRIIILKADAVAAAFVAGPLIFKLWPV